jgi:hypothetical protein
MDRSFLSQAPVVEASSQFVCIRLATYESAQEAELLKKIFLGRSGQLENTVFAILSPDGSKQLVRPGRSPEMSFRDAEDLADQMRTISKRYPTKTVQESLPMMTDLRLALNIAACDQRPLLVVVQDSQAVAQLELHRRDWLQQDFAGSAILALASPGEIFRRIGTQVKSGILVVDPGPFGDSGRIVARFNWDASTSGIAAALSPSDSKSKSIREHVREGHRRGVHWDTVIPVTDPGGRR